MHTLQSKHEENGASVSHKVGFMVQGKWGRYIKNQSPNLKGMSHGTVVHSSQILVDEFNTQ